LTNGLTQEIAGLSPEKRLLLDRLLRKRGVDLAASLILPGPRDGAACPLSFAQQRLWFLDRLAPESRSYNIGVAVRLDGALDVRALGAALRAMVERHEVLRTTFVMAEDDGGEPRQRIAQPGPCHLAVLDLRGTAAGEPGALEAALRQRIRQPFDLGQGPLFRSLLARLGERRHVLLLTLHHIVSDAWSTAVLVRELTVLYAAFAARRRSPLPPLPVQYADYARWQRQHLQGDELGRHLTFWQQELAGLADLDLPADRQRPAVQSFRGGEQSLRLPRSLAAALSALARELDATLHVVLLAAFQALLGRYSGQSDFAVASPTANRGRTEIEGLIGLFVNTVAARCDLSGNPDFAALAAQARRRMLEAQAHLELPFEMLISHLKAERDLSRNPLVQVAFQTL
jgi:hypothetical protein